MHRLPRGWAVNGDFPLPVFLCVSVLLVGACRHGCGGSHHARLPDDATVGDGTFLSDRDAPNNAMATPDQGDAGPTGSLDQSSDGDVASTVDGDFGDPKASDMDSGENRCNCLQPGTTCALTLDGPWCVLRDTPCGEDGQCPVGFTCGSVGYCQCDGDESICRPQCVDDLECPSRTICDLSAGMCVDAPSCWAHWDCLDGYWCLDGACAPPGTKPAGESCERNSECESVDCFQVCNSRCFNDSECWGSQRCYFAGSRGAFCVNRTSAERCTAECAPEERCVADQCRSSFCLRNRDCAVGDCTVVTDDAGVGECMGESTRCKPQEFTFFGEERCLLPGRCASTADCPAPYTCEPTTFGPTFCSREPD